MIVRLSPVAGMWRSSQTIGDPPVGGVDSILRRVLPNQARKVLRVDRSAPTDLRAFVERHNRLGVVMQAFIQEGVVSLFLQMRHQRLQRRLDVPDGADVDWMTATEMSAV